METFEKSRLIRIKEVISRTGLSRTTIWRLERNGKFPKRKKITVNLIGWIESDIDNWINNPASFQKIIIT